jgi:hypothetical protein
VNTGKVTRLAEQIGNKDFVQKCDDYEFTWAPVDEEIRGLCELRRPGHRSLDDVYPKVVIVDGAYRAGLSRCLTDSKDKSFNAQREVAVWMCGAGRKTVESSIKAVDLRSDSDLVAFLRGCLVAHGAIVCELMKLGDSGKYPGSFVSKYLHFHNGDFVIYDGVADGRLTKLFAEVGGSQASDSVPTSCSYDTRAIQREASPTVDVRGPACDAEAAGHQLCLARPTQQVLASR